MFEPMALRGRRILITGGGSGLGLAMAECFASQGASLVICGRNSERLNAASEQLVERFGPDVESVTCDIRDPQAVEDLFEQTWNAGAIDVLVNNAAASFVARTDRLSARAADAILAPTMHGGLYCTLQAGRRWIDAGHPGVVLSILSTSTRTGRAFTVPSAMAKSAMLAMTRSLAVEWGPYGIRCVAIAPGPFPTAGAQRALDPTATRLTVGRRPSNPLGRTGKPEELATLAAFLVSDSAAYINGEMIAIDGGQHLRTSGAEDLLQWTESDWDQIESARRR